MCSFETEHFFEAVVRFAHKGLGKIPPRNARLVRHQHDLEPRITEASYCGGGPGDESELLQVAEVSHLLDDGAVPVEKYRAVHMRRPPQPVPSREGYPLSPEPVPACSKRGWERAGVRGILLIEIVP